MSNSMNRILILILISLLINSNTTGQTVNEFQGDIVHVTINDSLEFESISINLVENLGWHPTIIPLFKEGTIIESHFPRKAGIYNLTINYADELFYNEILLFRLDPKSEKLQFEFYRDRNRIYCKIRSTYASELNKEIVLNKLADELKSILKAND